MRSPRKPKAQKELPCKLGGLFKVSVFLLQTACHTGQLCFNLRFNSVIALPGTQSHAFSVIRLTYICLCLLSTLKQWTFLLRCLIPARKMPFPPAVQHFSNKTRPSTLVNFCSHRVHCKGIFKCHGTCRMPGATFFKTRLHDLIIERVRRYNIRNNTKLVSPFNELFSACISYVRLLPVPSTLVAAELATVPVLSSNYRIRFTAVFWHGRQKWFQLRSYMF